MKLGITRCMYCESAWIVRTSDLTTCWAYKCLKCHQFFIKTKVRKTENGRIK